MAGWRNFSVVFSLCCRMMTICDDTSHNEAAKISCFKDLRELIPDQKGHEDRTGGDMGCTMQE